MGFKNFKRLLISIPKFIELNSESKPELILVLVWVSTRDPDPIYIFFGSKMSDINKNLKFTND